MTKVLRIGLMPLVDAAPIVIAREMGFGLEEGIALEPVIAPSWSTMRDQLAHGRIEAAHMLAPVPVAMALGLGGPARFEALKVLSVNGNVMGVSTEVAARMAPSDFSDPKSVAHALAGLDGPLRIGVPFQFSMHRELVAYLLESMALPGLRDTSFRTVPPPLMAEAIANGEIDAFCVGEPWGSIAVETGVGELILPGAAIWKFAPEKVLATRIGWAEAYRDRARGLTRALWRAGRWLSDYGNRMVAVDLLARSQYLGVSVDVIERALTEQFVVSGRGGMRRCPGFVHFHKGAAGFPWKSQAQWIAARLAKRHGLDPGFARDAAEPVFRSDLYRDYLRDLGADLPAASEKIEGAIPAPTEVPAEKGHMTLQSDVYFDGRIFDPGT